MKIGILISFVIWGWVIVIFIVWWLVKVNVLSLLIFFFGKVSGWNISMGVLFILCFRIFSWLVVDW